MRRHKHRILVASATLIALASLDESGSAGRFLERVVRGDSGLSLRPVVLLADSAPAVPVLPPPGGPGPANPASPPSVLSQQGTADTGATGAGEEGRYFFGLLDHRSRYGTGFFPEHFRQTSLDLEHEIRLDYFHGEDKVRRENEIEGEVEWGVGNLTLTVEGEWEGEREFEDGAWASENGFQTVKFKAHHPVFQFVSDDDVWDYTAVAKLSVGVPLINDVHHDDYEIYPLVGQMLRVGEHLSLQTWTGVNFVVGPEHGGENEFRYGALVGWNVYHQDLPLPGVVSFTPVLELDGQTFLATDTGGHDENRLFGVVGTRIALDAIGPAEPRLGIGYLFPIDQGARRELDWGVQMSVIFEF